MARAKKKQNRDRLITSNTHTTFLNLPSSNAGEIVNKSTVLCSTAFTACARRLADSIATLPCILYERVDDGNRRKASEHYLYRLLNARPNNYQTAFQFKQQLILKIVFDGACYIFTEIDNEGDIKALHIINSDVREHIYPDRIEYNVSLTNGSQVFYDYEICKMHMFSRDGVNAISFIELVKEALGLSLAQSKYMARFFSNNAVPAGYLEHPEQLSEEAKERLVVSFEKRHSGAENSHKLAVLEEGLKFHPTGINPADAELLNSYQFSITDILRVFCIPPHLAGDLTRSTYSNISHQGIEYVKYTLLPWLEMITQSFEQKLLLERERDKYYFEFLTDKYQQGDFDTRINSYKTGVLSGFYTPNEVRKLENLPPINGGDDLLIPANMIPLQSINSEQKQNQVPDNVIDMPMLNSRFLPLLQTTLGRVVKREIIDVRNLCVKYLDNRDNYDEFISKSTDAYKQLAGYFVENLKPLVRAINPDFLEEKIDDLSEKIANVFIITHMEALSELRDTEEIEKWLDSLPQTTEKSSSTLLNEICRSVFNEN